jgi:hypothetical protein
MSGRERPAYPTFPASCWWPLRERFKRSLPPAITPDYLQAVLEVEPKTARNLVPMLRQMGLVDEAGAPRERANSWRVDAEYRHVCHAIRDELYPASLRHAVPDPSSDFDAAVRWFMKASGVGTAAAKRMARFYALLSKADPAEVRERIDRKKEAPLRRPSPRSGSSRDAYSQGDPRDRSSGRGAMRGSPSNGSTGSGTGSKGAPGDGSFGNGSNGSGSSGSGAGGNSSNANGSAGNGSPGNGSPGNGSPGNGASEGRPQGNRGAGGNAGPPPDSLSASLPPLGGHEVTPDGITLRPVDLPAAESVSGAPVQLVVQIQLPAGATAEQIDQLVASIARHLAPQLKQPPREGRR